MITTAIETIRKVEHAEATLQGRWAEAVRAHGLDYPAATAEIDGVRCVDKGPDWLWSRGFAAGLDGPVEASTIDAIEAWYAGLGASAKPAKIDLSPVAHSSLGAELGRRGYRPAFWDSVLICEPNDDAPPMDSIASERASAADALAWGELLTTCFTAGGPPEDLHERMPEKLAGFVHAEGASCFFATIDGQRVGGGMMGVVDGVALLHAAGTLPAFRGRGVQAELLRARIAEAHAQGCGLCCAQADPNNFASLRNMQRAGFEVVLSRVCMEQLAGVTG